MYSHSVDSFHSLSQSLDYLTNYSFCFVLRYSDFVVHEINKQGKIVHLDDLSIPAEAAEVGYWTTFHLPLYFSFVLKFLLIRLDPQVVIVILTCKRVISP